MGGPLDSEIRTRLESQIAFIKEIDRAKSILRRTRLLDNSRYENDAEHSWHLAIMAMLLAEYANEPGLDVGKVIRMVLIHDVVEIDAGDAFIYDAVAQSEQAAKEREAADRVFGFLPTEQRDEFRALWDEFDAKETNEAKFAGALDRLQPLIHNAATQGYSWKQHGIRRNQVEAINSRIGEGSELLWSYAQELIRQAVHDGHLAE